MSKHAGRELPRLRLTNAEAARARRDRPGGGDRSCACPCLDAPLPRPRRPLRAAGFGSSTAGTARAASASSTNSSRRRSSGTAVIRVRMVSAAAGWGHIDSYRDRVMRSRIFLIVWPRSPTDLRGSFFAPKRATSASPAPEAPRVWTQCGLTCRGIGAKYLRLRPQLDRSARSCEPHLKAEHMAAPTHAANVKKALANSEPSTHGT